MPVEIILSLDADSGKAELNKAAQEKLPHQFDSLNGSRPESFLVSSLRTASGRDIYTAKA